MDTPSPVQPTRFVALVPVKPPARGKSRLGDLPDDVRRQLAVAFAHDTLAAAAATPDVVGVLAVTDDATVAGEFAACGYAVIPDGASGLNESLAQAAAEAGRRWSGAHVVVLLADLPCLTPADLAQALQVLPSGPSFVRDHHGTGTTMYASAPGDFAPRFGPQSATAHLHDGAEEIVLDVATLRLDVDDRDDLALALEVGVGSHTARAASAL